MPKFNRKSYTTLHHTRKQIHYITENTPGIPLDENDRRIFGVQGRNSQIFRAVYITDLAVIYSVGRRGSEREGGTTSRNSKSPIGEKYFY